ncbi:hypothetical protein ScalyP_jg681 [Parmales sp. scaly parma]|nr:hypothetical protein ScalyP_jg681 [Parmales sp. scaly parma]
MKFHVFVYALILSTFSSLTCANFHTENPLNQRSLRSHKTLPKDPHVIDLTTSPLTQKVRGGAFPLPVLKNVNERLASAIVLIILLTTVVKKFQLHGLTALVLVSQLIMFREITAITTDPVKEAKIGVPVMTVQRYLWLATAMSAFTLPVLVDELELFPLPSLLPAPVLTYAGFSLSLILLIVSMNNQNATPELIKYQILSASGSSAALTFLIGQSAMMLETASLYGLRFIVIPLILVAANDTFAYLAGCIFGKHPLIGKLSPKKTVEGFIGALLGTIVLAWYMDLGGETNNLWVWVALFASTVGPFGGFLASSFKRAFSVKDFGKLIPGHGGVIDRVDCQLLVASFVNVLLNMLHA